MLVKNNKKIKSKYPLFLTFYTFRHDEDVVIDE